MVRFTVGCPVCGLFRQGVDAVGLALILPHHPYADVLGFDGDYGRWVDDLLEEARMVLS